MISIKSILDAENATIAKAKDILRVTFYFFLITLSIGFQRPQIDYPTHEFLATILKISPYSLSRW
ncbi:hypothetical protein DP113_24380 [Brasilonema octagenarum UFV-E1]|nr:hypothetical protein DP113_24380 [Brasilonema octagenarum UFV-E1]